MGYKKYLVIVLVLFVKLAVVANSAFGAWGTATVDSTGITQLNTYTSIAVGTSGAAYISYFDNTNRALKYATNVSGAWVTTTVDSTGGDMGRHTSIAVGTSGAAYISYYDNTNGDLEYATNVSGSWGTTTVDNTGVTGKWTSIAVGTSGAAYISYHDDTNRDLMYATNVSGAWGTTTVASTGVIGEHTSIAVGTSGAVYISYYDVTNHALGYATNVSGSWGTTTVDGGAGGRTMGMYTSIAVGTSGAAYISYYDIDDSALRYATNVSGAWGTTTVDSAGDTGLYTSIAVGTSGAVYISYNDNTNSDLRYATNVSGAWVTTTVDSTGVTGRNTSIAVGTSGAAYISYYDWLNGNIMYATTATPAVTTGAASNVTTDSATLAGTVNGRGLSTTAMFSYGVASGSYTGTSTTQSVSGTDVSIGISGLSSGTTYYYRIVANSGAGTSTGSEASFTTSSSAPTVTTGSATSVTTSSAILNGTVNANDTSTTAWFDYGITSGSYTGSSTTQRVSGTSSTAVSIGISGLSSSTSYYYRIAAENDVGTSYGSETSFTTSSPPPPEEPPPRVTLTVTSVSPSNGATSVGTNTVITATFSDNMNGSTLTTDTFKVNGGGSDVAGSVSTNGNKATFTPSTSLAYDTTYTATITTGAQAANYAGTTLDSNYSWSFTTASAPIVPTPTPTATPSPTPTTPGVSGELYLSKEVAYLSGDTVAVTVVDADRNANAASEDTLTTALKVTALNYFAGGDLILDLKENAVNSGTFLATIKTGTTTIGEDSSSARSNVGTIKTVQGGTATVIYTDTTPNASTITKTLSFNTSDATLVFDAELYTVGSYAVVTHVDAEENRDNTLEDTLLNHAAIETSSINRARMKLTETGADTGTFKGSILVSSDSTLDNERIQTFNGDTLTVGCTDETNTSGAPREVTAVSHVVSSVECTVGKMTVSSVKLQIERNKSEEVTVTVIGTNGCPVEGKQVTADVRRKRDSVSVSPASRETDADGHAVFTIESNEKTGTARVMFRVDELRKSMYVKVKK